MSIWYGLHGTAEVRMAPEVDRIVAEFNDLAREIDADLDNHRNGTATVEFGGGVFCSYATAGAIEEKAQQLGPFVSAPARLIYDCDGQPRELPIVFPPRPRRAKTIPQ